MLVACKLSATSPSTVFALDGACALLVGGSIWFLSGACKDVRKHVPHGGRGFDLNGQYNGGMSRWDGDDWELTLGIHMPKLSDEVGSPKIARQKGWMPRIDLLESSTHLMVRAELAGVPSRNVQIVYNSTRNTLTIRGDRPDELAKTPQRFQPHLLEIDEGGFSRELLLPEVELDMNHIRTEFKHGILTILLPKVGQENPVYVVEQVTLRKR